MQRAGNSTGFFRVGLHELWIELNSCVSPQRSGRHCAIYLARGQRLEPSGWRLKATYPTSISDIVRTLFCYPAKNA
ncbi:hypothetical protein thalar_01853 [Litoreibacter arenae DSM 19593]|uniref:Uncharacterized protein n=1 Tax=Litoreibacter arenae DSM 19593 TaxID=1123360 RepID=S9QC98_9RHOB|nr:hypothetical protein thalar_01853 [Litoreibacter arenae DSM 19593]